MEKVVLEFEDLKIPFFYDSFLSDDWCKALTSQLTKKTLIITDDSVKKLYCPSLIKKLNLSNYLVLSSQPGEAYKTLETINSYLDLAYRWGADRSCTIICLGGGIPGNIGGLLAGLMYRGLPFIHIPTSIIGAFDSVISLKQAVNSKVAKNAIGIYYQPKSIFTSPEFFTTLPLREIRSGICETIKNVLTILPSSLPDLSSSLKNALRLEKEALDLVKKISIDAKQEVMKEDKFEKKKALVLEYGHTVGHAIELADSQKRRNSISHGEAVGLGMLIEAEISHKLGYLSSKDLHIHYHLLSQIGLEVTLPPSIEVEEIINLMKKDNKRGYLDLNDDEASIVLLEGVGSLVNKSALPLTSVPLRIVAEVLDNFSPKKAIGL